MSPKTILAFLGGAAAGAALGMLLSSEKGSKIRKDIANKARGLADAVLEKAEDIINDAEEAANKTRSEKSR